MFAWTSPPAALTPVKLAVNARDRRFELTFTISSNPPGQLPICRACLRSVTVVYFLVNVLLVIGIFSRSACVLSRVT